MSRFAGRDWQPAPRREAVVRIVPDEVTRGLGTAPPVPVRDHGYGGRNAHTTIVLLLLVASATLALYDLYLLASTLAGGG